MSSSSVTHGWPGSIAARSESERAAHDKLATFTTDGFGYFLEQSTRPQTIGYSLLDKPIGLAAWMLDHDTDSYYKMSKAFVELRDAFRPLRQDAQSICGEG
uniref:hypothetical protein n=1 Tax=Paractinoplanes polyasparticus TaxID=2856853 RepID=UPI0027DEC70C|nr:hypothetical protein [Actinoplanes polyasparticus]